MKDPLEVKELPTIDHTGRAIEQIEDMIRENKEIKKDIARIEDEHLMESSHDLIEIDRLRTALEKYSNPKDWVQIESGGGIFDEQDGDPVMAFNLGEDSPWGFAREALSNEVCKPVIRNYTKVMKIDIKDLDGLSTSEYKYPRVISLIIHPNGESK